MCYSLMRAVARALTLNLVCRTKKETNESSTASLLHHSPNCTTLPSRGSALPRGCALGSWSLPQSLPYLFRVVVLDKPQAHCNA